MSMQKQIEAIHNRLTRANEAEHVVFLDDFGHPRAVPLVKFLGVYRAPPLEVLEADILNAVGGSAIAPNLLQKNGATLQKTPVRFLY